MDRLKPGDYEMLVMDEKEKMSDSVTGSRVLIFYYSFSSQTRGIVSQLSAGIEVGGDHIVCEKIEPLLPLRFPIGTIPSTLRMMITTLFRRPSVPIKPLSDVCFDSYDLIVLAGPTWSYNPSGPVLSLIQRDGPVLFSGRKVIPLISCRGYWWLHLYGLRRLLKVCGATVPNCIIFSHPSSEPWRTVGVFLKLAGKMPEKSCIGRYYPKYGHSRQQQQEAFRFGGIISDALKRDIPLSGLNFRTPIALP
ncbi:MAG: hypothetical protein KAK02_02430 [Desulfobulbaceae bacterium]|nr:hypothetical protein [Desulfobulbaceae bacterium]